MLFERSLLERIDNPPEDTKRKLNLDLNALSDSILAHLYRMLNTRHGDSIIHPDYGMPDMNELLEKFPDAVFELKKAIQISIEKYEPRLKKVVINHIADEHNPCTLKFEITAQLAIDGKDNKFWFETFVDATGKARVKG